MGDQLHDKREANCRILKVDLGTKGPVHQDSTAQSRGEQNDHRVGAGKDYSGVVIGRPPRSPDLTPTDFLLLPRVKTAFNGRRMTDTWDSKTKQLN
jgi:hypothetical protein